MRKQDHSRLWILLADAVFAVLCLVMKDKIPWVSRILAGSCLMLLTALCFLKEEWLEKPLARVLFVIACLLGSAGILYMIF